MNQLKRKLIRWAEAYGLNKHQYKIVKSGQDGVIFHLWTSQRHFTIVARPPMLSAVMSFRAPAPGDNFTASGVLPSGQLSKETWHRFMCTVLGCEVETLKDDPPGKQLRRRRRTSDEEILNELLKEINNKLVERGFVIDMAPEDIWALQLDARRGATGCLCRVEINTDNAPTIIVTTNVDGLGRKPCSRYTVPVGDPNCIDLAVSLVATEGFNHK